MTDAEKQALALIHAATITPAVWADRIQHGYKGKPYNYRETNYFKALEKIRVGGAVPQPPTPPPSTLTPYQSIIFCGQNPLDALGAPAYYRVAFTADPAYDGYATADSANQLRAAGHDVYVWYVPTEVSKARADEVAQRLGATIVLGQCETADQFDASVGRDARKALVGNLSALTPTQLSLVATGTVVVVNELYRNCQPGQQPDWKNANKGVPGNCVATYQDGGCQRMPLSQYVADGMFVPHRDSLYGPGLTSDDYATLRSLG